MRKAVVILVAGLMLGAAVFAGAFYCAQHICVQRAAQSTDDLDWLRMEFHLSDADLARIRKLHEGYKPICATNCAKIAIKKRELARAVAAGTNTTATLDQLRAEIVELRATCQSQMLAHFEEVSREMPAEQGKRYLAEMKRLTLGAHELVEQSMSGTNHEAHGDH